MKKIIKIIYLSMLIFIFICLFSTHILLASSKIPFEYNIIPNEPNNSIIDTKAQKELTFNLYEPIEKIYYNENLIEIKKDSFSIDVSKLSGENTLTFKDANNQTVSFSYYFSNKKGKVEDYELVEGKNLTTYVTTYKNIKIIYSSKEKNVAKKLTSYIKKLPTTILKNVETIILIPYENVSNIAGVASNKTITLYKFSKYSSSTQKNIIYHEIAHTWANKLIEEKVIDYSYTDYSTFVNKDNNYVSKYSQAYIAEKEKYSEDFADSIAFLFINQRSFKKKFPNRFDYINNLLKQKLN